MQKQDLEMLQDMPFIFFVKDEEGKLLWANRKFFEAIQRPASDVLGKTDREVFEAEVAEPYIKNDRQALETGESLNVTERVPRIDGKQEEARVCKFAAELDGKKCLFGVAISMG